MRICELRFENLNSLYGQWSIDFTRPEYAQDGIFVITGPTGAGKSTLLDAICLALYARTPRLKSISKTSNEIMSRQSGECFAEVTFETRSGRFVAHWSQRRAHKKPDGNLVESKHEISEAATGALLASKKRETLARVIKETGMDFDRFTRSMLLAQGGFAAFLQAAPDERAPILEQITGTKIYSLISQKVHERLKAEDKELEMLEARMGGIRILSQEDEISVTAQLNDKKKKEVALRKTDDELASHIAWLSNIERLKKEIAELDGEFENVLTRQAAFEPDRERLKKAQLASELDQDYATLQAIRQQQKQDQASISALKKTIPDLEKRLESKKAAFEIAVKNEKQISEKQKVQWPIIKKIRAMDLQIVQGKKGLKQVKDEVLKIENVLSMEKNNQQKAEKEQAGIQRELTRMDSYLADHKADSGLSMILDTVREKSGDIDHATAQIKTISEQLTQKKQTLQKETTRHQNHLDTCSKLKQTHDGLVRKAKALTNEMETVLDGRSLKGYRAEHSSLLREMAYQRKIESLEAERNHLVTGEPCPLCGALEHPFAHGQMPDVDETQEKIDAAARVIAKIEEIEVNLKQIQDQEKQADLDFRDAEKKAVENQHCINQLEKEGVQLGKDLDQARQTHEKFKTAMVKLLEPFGVAQAGLQKTDTVCRTLEDRMNLFHQYESEKQALGQALNTSVASIKQTQGSIKTLTRTLEDKTMALNEHQAHLETLEKQRGEHYGTKDPDKEEALLESDVAAARNAREKAAKSKEALQEEWAAQRARMSDLEKATRHRQPLLDEQQTLFIKNAVARGFKDEPAFVSCCLAHEEKHALAQQAKHLDDQQHGLETRKKDRLRQLETERGKKMTRVSREDLEKEQHQVRLSLKELGQNIGALKQKLSDNTDAKKRMAQQAQTITARKKERQRWEMLHSLIGSADGKKYRNFAQGITFELMVSHANQQLEKMSDRYLLIRDEQQPLELNIVDDYQAGEIRSTKNLSGGESFIVSLSLALGLSNMAGGKIRVDSLFLDEGFGTLDEDALETALQSLSSLHQQGKLIGVISHVPALKENINTQIEIIPVAGGKSRISGPGCGHQKGGTHGDEN